MKKHALGRCVLVLLFLALIPTFLQSAFIRDLPLTLVQPDGQKISVFVTGDEFHRWVHDRNGYAIIKNPESGYYVYAVRSGGAIAASQYRVGVWNPRALGIEKNLGPTLAGQSPALRPLEEQARVAAAPTTGTINNIVIFIRFSDDSEFGDPISTYDALFNAGSPGDNSLRNYYLEVSYGQLTIPSTFYPLPSSGGVVSYQDSHPRNYYRPYDSVYNPIGYTSDGTAREHALLSAAVSAVASLVPPGLNLDGDNDGEVDDVCFMIRGGPDAWAGLLWPHMYYLFSSTVSISGKRVWSYNVQLQQFMPTRGTGVLCHEMFHVLGAPDLYRYAYGSMDIIGPWDLMDSDLNPPQHTSAYMKYRYGKWISSLPEITTAGTYSLQPLTSAANNEYRIKSPASNTEYFVVEYRKRTGTFESSLPGEGLLVFRINTLASGNGKGPPDEVYVYRPNGTLTQEGNLNAAPYSADGGRTDLDDSTNPSGFLSDGTEGKIKIFDVGALGDTISFSVDWASTPSLTTAAITNITESTADCGGNVTLDFGLPVTDRGVCWATLSHPTTSNSLTHDGSGTGSFVSQLTGLEPGGVQYYVRAYATNSAGTAYGNELAFKTLILPTVTTSEVRNTTETSADSGGNVTADGGSPITERGVCWSTSASPTVADSRTQNGSGTGAFSSHLTGLTAGTTYHVRAYATNAVGTRYGNDLTFIALTKAVVTTAPITNINQPGPLEGTAEGGGRVVSDNGRPVTERGVCWNFLPNPTIAQSHTHDGSGKGSFVSHLTGIREGTLYYVRAYATNSAGTSYGDAVTFRALILPYVTTASITNVASTSADSGGSVNSNGGPEVLERGVCWGRSADPTTANAHTHEDCHPGTGPFISHLTGLVPGTVYYVRAYATNVNGTAYGDDANFRTPGQQTFALTSPFSGAQWAQGTTQSIQWTKGSTTDPWVQIELYKGAATKVTTIALQAANSGSFSWTIPAALSPATDYRIKLTTHDGSASALSEFFSIVKPAMTITNPAVGTVWVRRAKALISWTKTGNQNANVKILLFRGSTKVQVIAAKTPNDGQFDWPVPASLPAASNYRVKIKTADGLLSSTSPLFTIQ